MPCEHINEHTKAFPLKAQLVEDYPQWDSEDYLPMHLLEQFIEWENEEGEDYFEHVEFYPYHKLGGYPYFCQSGHSYAGSKYVFQVAADYKAEMNFIDSGNLHFYRKENGEYEIYIDFY